MKTSTRNLFIGAAVILAVLLAIRYLNSRNGFEGFERADTFTLYYAKWCPHCKTIAPVFADFSKDGSVTVGGKTVFLAMVEADEDADKMKGKPVKGFPTFLLEKANGQNVEFDGERSPEGWKTWLSNNL
jgi:thiol-disulfide isomerase/thioredoxin